MMRISLDVNAPSQIYTCENTDLDRREILRYMRCREAIDEVTALLDECIEECRDLFRMRAVWRTLPVSVDGNSVDLSFVREESRDLARRLEGCDCAVIFAATVGLDVDRAIARAALTSPARALCYDAIGAERIEALCDCFNREITVSAGSTRPRFSPGYGDLPLKLQRDIFTVLDCPRTIGLTLSESLLMSPQKSVTAIVGIIK